MEQRRIEEHVPLVYRVVRRMRDIPPHMVDDAIQEGMFGLLDACARFNPDRGASFSTYAAMRIRGAALDYLRSQDVLSRNARRDLHLVEHAESELAADQTQRADEDVLAAKAGMSVEKLRRLRMGAPLAVPESIDHLGEEADGEERIASSHDLFEETATRFTRRYVQRCLAMLPSRLREALELYYMHDLTMAEVAARMGITESRVSQLHTEAMPKLRRIYEKGLPPEPVQLPEPVKEQPIIRAVAPPCETMEKQMRRPIERACQWLECDIVFSWQPPPIGGRVPKYCERHRYRKVSGAAGRRRAMAVQAAREAQAGLSQPHEEQSAQLPAETATQLPEVVVPYLPKAPTANDYAQVLADMEAKRDALNEAIAALRNVASLVGLPPVAAPRAMGAAA